MHARRSSRWPKINTTLVLIRFDLRNAIHHLIFCWQSFSLTSIINCSIPLGYLVFGVMIERKMISIHNDCSHSWCHRQSDVCTQKIYMLFSLHKFKSCWCYLHTREQMFNYNLFLSKVGEKKKKLLICKICTCITHIHSEREKRWEAVNSNWFYRFANYQFIFWHIKDWP